MELLIEIPSPSTIEEILWFGIGLTFARAFAESDHALQNTEWFKTLESSIAKYLVKSFMDAFHHWWIGGILIVYNVQISTFIPSGFFITPLIVYWVGWGILIDDLPDLPPRIKKYFKYIFNGNGESE
jgi:hypothetical protein